MDLLWNCTLNSTGPNYRPTRAEILLTHWLWVQIVYSKALPKIDIIPHKFYFGRNLLYWRLHLFGLWLFSDQAKTHTMYLHTHTHIYIYVYVYIYTCIYICIVKHIPREELRNKTTVCDVKKINCVTICNDIRWHIHAILTQSSFQTPCSHIELRQNKLAMSYRLKSLQEYFLQLQKTTSNIVLNHIWHSKALEILLLLWTPMCF